MFIGNIKHDAVITKIKLSSVSFAPHSRIFLVVGSSISTARTTVRNCHVVDLFVFCGILASFLDWISFSVTVVNPRPESSLSGACKHAGRSKDPWCENWNCELLALCLHPQMKIQNCFPKAQLQYRHRSCFSLRNKRLYFWLFRLFLTFTAKN